MVQAHSGKTVSSALEYMSTGTGYITVNPPQFYGDSEYRFGSTQDTRSQLDIDFNVVEASCAPVFSGN